jgi:isoleucyl-tRNA synthetase
VHLTDFPSAEEFPADHDLVAAMDNVRAVASAALSLRKAKGLRVRLPLSKLTVASPVAAQLRPFADLVADEVNVKAVEITDEVSAYCQQVLTVVPRALGPRVGKAVQQVIKAVKAGDWGQTGAAVVAGGVELREGEYDLKLVAADPTQSAPLPGGEGVVVLDTEVTPELAAEGLARDVVRVVQQARRDADLDVSDRIVVAVAAAEEVRAAVAAYTDFVAREVLADTVDFAEGVDGFAGEVGEGERVTVAVRRV